MAKMCLTDGIKRLYAFIFCVCLLISAVLITPRVFVLIHQQIVENKILPADDIRIIDREFNVILNGNQSMQTIIYYRFYPQSSITASAYKGRVAVTTQSKTKNFLSDHTELWVLGKRDNQRIQDILLNKIEYKIIDDIKESCIESSGEQYCEYMKTLSERGYKSMIMVPVDRKTDHSVIGYVLFMFTDLVPETDLQSTVDRIRLHLSKIEPSLQYLRG